MAKILTTPNQFLNQSAVPIDKGMEPVNSYTDLATVNRSCRYIGMAKTVLNKVTEYDEDEGEDVVKSTYPMEFVLSGSTGNGAWRLNKLSPVKTHKEVETLLTKYNVPSKAFSIGIEIMVEKDETNNNKPTKYWITAIDTTANTVTWERCDNGSSTAPSITVEGTDIESAGV